MDKPDQAELLKQFEAELAGMGPADLETLLNRLVGRASEVNALERTGPSQRRERRADVVTYRVRVDLTGTRPPTPAWTSTSAPSSSSDRCAGYRRPTLPSRS